MTTRAEMKHIYCNKKRKRINKKDEACCSIFIACRSPFCCNGQEPDDNKKMFYSANTVNKARNKDRIG